MKTYQEFCSVVTKQLFKIIDEQGSLLKWHKGWDNSRGNNQLPIGTNGIYHGANLFLLFIAQYEEGFKYNEWLTFNQVNKQGAQIKKGAKSKGVFFWTIKKTEEEEDGKKQIKEKPIFKAYRVFNVEQTTLAPSGPVPVEFQENTIDALVNKLGATISHFGNQPYYEGNQDAIILPRPESFSTKENYYATLLHELVHWTGKEGRLPRECHKKYGIDKKAYAQEELIAEMGSVFLASYFGLKAELENHASYIQSWKTILSESEIMSAVNKAAKAFEWIIEQ